MKTLLYLIIFSIGVMACTKTELVETIEYIRTVDTISMIDTVRTPQPNITLSGTKDLIKADLNTYTYWRDRSYPTGNAINMVNVEICATKELADKAIVDSLVYEFTLCTSKLESNWEDIDYIVNLSRLMCTDSLESIHISQYYDSLQLANYKYYDFVNFVENSIEFIQIYSK